MPDAASRGSEAVRLLCEAGRARGFDVLVEYPVPGGRIDVVWALTAKAVDLPGVSAALPIVAFDVESSWRTRKHIKGDYLNLFDLGAALGVIVLLGDGEDVEGTRRFAQLHVDRPGPTVVVWTDADLARLASNELDPVPPVHETPAPVVADGHAGKYRSLWAWLRDQPGPTLSVTFVEIEAATGQPLPPSCRRHAAHWSGYDGSAVARAIYDAGWSATNVSVSGETLTLVRR